MKLDKLIGLGFFAIAISLAFYLFWNRDSEQSGPENLSLVEDVEVNAAMIETAKGESPEIAVLKPEFIKRAYTTTYLCNGKRIFLYSDFDVEVPHGLAKEPGITNAGSGGYNVRIFLEEAPGKLRMVWNSVLINPLGFQARGSCPEMISYLHGGEFNRSGNQYGIGILRFESGLYQIARSPDGYATEIQPPSK